jgi:poly-gamma-glutamate synthesis protein (capsule biosynthesis protein)
MLGRGVDQIMPHPGAPQLYERFVEDAGSYVALAERRNGPIPRHCPPAYVWGDALDEIARAGAQLRILNLETAITTNRMPVPKGINYKMDPRNLVCLREFAPGVCTLANNHVLDWGRKGLLETLEVLERASVPYSGAGRNLDAATAPAIVSAGEARRVLVFALGDESSGIPGDWAAGEAAPGVALLPDLSLATAADVARRINALRRPGDLVVVSIHWGSNWGYNVPARQRAFARALIDAGACDVLHGHSSHHPRPIEVHRGRLILYGCGDFINDYEGIEGYEAFRGELALAYLPRFSEENLLEALTLLPFRIRRFRLQRADAEETAWLRETLIRESAPFGTHIASAPGGHLAASWPP